MTDARQRRRSGFTLVEVLVSLALVGVILPAAMAALSLAMGLTEAARLRTEAAELAHGMLAEVAVTGTWQDADATGDFGDEWPRYTWRLQVEDWEEDSVKELTLTVTWEARGSERDLTMTTLAYTGGE